MPNAQWDGSTARGADIKSSIPRTASKPLTADEGWTHVFAEEMPSSSAVPRKVMFPITKPQDC